MANGLPELLVLPYGFLDVVHDLHMPETDWSGPKSATSTVPRHVHRRSSSTPAVADAIDARRRAAAPRHHIAVVSDFLLDPHCPVPCNPSRWSPGSRRHRR
ncbi:hypothetical protein ACQJBY_069984 [Aegilops geniculata]